MHLNSNGIRFGRKTLVRVFIMHMSCVPLSYLRHTFYILNGDLENRINPSAKLHKEILNAENNWGKKRQQVNKYIQKAHTHKLTFANKRNTKKTGPNLNWLPFDKI